MLSSRFYEFYLRRRTLKAYELIACERTRRPNGSQTRQLTASGTSVAILWHTHSFRWPLWKRPVI